MQSPELIISQEELRRLFDYNPETGVLSRLVKTGRNCSLGPVSSTPNNNGYILVRVGGRKHSAHRIIWAWMTGVRPDIDIDHRDLNKANNKWSNLRLATRSQNQANCNLPANNTSGKKGVSYCSKRMKFQAQIRVDDRLIFLGRFGKLEHAAAAYDKAAKQHFGEFARS